MGSIWQDVRYAGRSLAKAPGFTAVVVFVIAIGIGANVAIFSIMDRTMIRPLPYSEAERLVLGRATFDGNINPFASAYDYWDYRDLSTSFDQLAAFWGFTRNHTVTGGDVPERVAGVVVSIDLFRTLGVRPALGRNFTADEALENAAPVVIISHGYWQTRFGSSPDAIGGTLILDGVPHTIVGVMPPGFRFYHDADVWRPMRPDSDFIGQRRFHNWIMLGRLESGVTLEQAQAEVDVISAQLEAQYPDSNQGKALLLTELQEALVEDYRASLFMLMAAVGLVLLIACGNVAGLLLARGSARRTELSLRAALGASGSRVLRQLLTESLVTALVAGALGVLLALWIQGLFLRLLEIEVPGMGEPGLSVTMLVAALVLSLLTGVLFGIVPALRASRGDLAEDLKAAYRTTDAGGTRFRSGLVVAQVAVSIVLLIGAGLLIRSFARLSGVDAGFDAGRLLTAEIRLPSSDYPDPQQRIQFYTSLVENIRGIPGVTGVGIINRLPIRDPANNTYVWPADRPPIDPGDTYSAFTRIVLPGYFETMGIPLLAGRGIEDADVDGAPPVIVISRAMADTLFPDGNAIGRQVTIDLGQPFTFEVVGVVGDVLMNSLRSTSLLAFYASYRQAPFSTMRLAVRTAVDPASITGALRNAVWSLDRNIPVADVRTMKQVLARHVSGWRIRALALGIFAAVALLLAAVGLYGVLAYYVTRRHHEIGIRVALGASAGDVLELILRRGIALVAVGIVVGIAGALAVTRLLEDMLFSIEAVDPTTYIAVSLFFALVAVLACLLPAWRALRVDPMIALQAE